MNVFKVTRRDLPDYFDGHGCDECGFKRPVVAGCFNDPKDTAGAFNLCQRCAIKLIYKLTEVLYLLQD